MPATLPVYYSTLKPFREWFDTGVPILTYHKMGPHPRGVQIKGLYASQQLFATQLAELRQAGFTTIGLDQVVSTAQTPRRSIVLTFDDGCQNIHQLALPILNQERLRATVFLVTSCLGQLNFWETAVGEVPEPLMNPSQIHEWIAAGHEIGSHTLTHPYLTRLSQAKAQEEVAASKKKLEDTFGVPVRHFCYPYGDWNEAVRELVIESGYHTACTTQFGINTAATSPFALCRITARYPTRSLKAAVARWGSWFALAKGELPS
jgi:peptidoglycan/xylan/chitin deacetylase (PgdA/CDA1 family)